MAICQFYLRGQCKFGNNCRNEHPAQRPSGFGTSWTGSSSNTGAANNKTVAFTVDSVTKDFTAGVDKPLWPLSSYGPSKYEPNVISNLDESPEELRVKAMQALRAGNAMEYQKYEAEKIAASEQMYSSALNNAKEVYQRAFDQSGGASDSPYAPKLSSFGSPSAQSAFSSNSNSAFAKPASGFGAFSGATSAFGRPAFGQSAFGQSGFGQTQPSTSAFGNTTAPTNSVFGQPSAPSAFGQTTAPAFGQTNQPQSAFGKPVSAFGSTTPAVGFSAFANSPSTTANSSGGGFSAFAGAGNSAFGSPAAASTGNSVFGKPAFAAPSAFGGGDTNKSPFGPTPAAPSAFAPANSNASVFGTPTAPASAFGNTTTSSPFGAANNASPFGQANNSAPSPFGQANNSAPSAFGTPQPLTSAFGNPNPSSFSAFGNSAPLNSNSSLSPFSSSNEQAKIGPPDFAKAMATVKAVPGKDKYDALLPPNYAQLLPAAAREAFEAPKFEWGKIPDFVPPVQFR